MSSLLLNVPAPLLQGAPKHIRSRALALDEPEQFSASAVFLNDLNCFGFFPAAGKSRWKSQIPYQPHVHSLPDHPMSYIRPRSPAEFDPETKLVLPCNALPFLIPGVLSFAEHANISVQQVRPRDPSDIPTERSMKS
jgi:hypothetical protein